MFSPKEMIHKGIFGGTYFSKLIKISDFPKEWFDGLDEKYYLSKKYQKKLNFFKIKSGLSQKEWEEKGWIHKDDPRGWFEWYCKYFLGRRHVDDERQIKRWQEFAGEKGRFRLWLITLIKKKKTKYDDYKVSPKIRQSLQHWGYVLTKKDFDKKRK